MHTVEHGSCYRILPPRSIRILDITPGERDDILHGNFRIAQLDTEQLHYEALSYTWADASGDSQRCRAIYIGPFWDVVLITRNCEHALRSVRPRNDKLMQHALWIDAICVNQNDVDERTSQVALMPEIYSGAAGVLVYLGPATESSTIGLEAISHSLSTNDCCHSPGKAICQGCRAAIFDLFKRPYFGRLWVVQEILLSKSITLYCGALAASLPFSKILELSPEDAWMVRRARRPLHPKHDLLSLLVESGGCACKDPRDKVFALLGIPSDWPGDQIMPDYSLSKEEVAIGIASYFVQVCKLGWLVLMIAGQERDKAKSLPSWVPDMKTSFKSPGIQKNMRDQLLRSSKCHDGQLYSEKHLDKHPWLFTFLQGKDDAPGGIPESSLLFFNNDTRADIRITSNHAHLKISAVKLCNVHQAFDLEDVDYRDDVMWMIMKPARKPKTMSHLLKMDTLVISPRLCIQMPQTSPPYWTRLSYFILEQDELYWLFGVECYAILRPDSSCNTPGHTLVCTSDLQMVRSPKNLVREENLWGFRLSPMHPEEVKNIRSALESTFPKSCSYDTHQTLSESGDELAVVKLAIRIIQEDYLWDEWKTFALKRSQILADSALLDLVISEVEDSAITTLKDGQKIKTSSKPAPADIQKPRSVAVLLWSILPQSMETPPSHRCPKTGSLSHSWDTSLVFSYLNTWAAITNHLMTGVGSDDVDLRSVNIESPETLNAFKGPRHDEWYSSWDRFRKDTGLDEAIWDTTGGILFLLKLHRRLHATQHLVPSSHFCDETELLVESNTWSWRYMEDRQRFPHRVKDVLYYRGYGVFPNHGQFRLRLDMHEYGLSWTSGTEVTIK